MPIPEPSAPLSVLLTRHGEQSSHPEVIARGFLQWDQARCFGTLSGRLVLTWDEHRKDIVTFQKVSPCPFLPSQVSQLRHELSMKDELLQFYTSAAEESEPESVCSTP